MIADMVIITILTIINTVVRVLPTMNWPSFLDLSGFNFDLSFFAYFVPLWLIADILNFIILYMTAKWSIKLIEIVLHRRILP